jgi:hypothetical protein
VLQTLSPSLTVREVIAYEQLHKEKLGTRAHWRLMTWERSMALHAALWTDDERLIHTADCLADIALPCI